MKRFVFYLIPCFFLFSCHSSPDPIQPDWTRELYFKNAQLAYNNEQYDLSLNYYQKYMDSFPYDTAGILACEYEIGFIYYRMKKYEIAREKLEALVSRYESLNRLSSSSGSIPSWPNVLAKKVLTMMEEKGV